MSDHSRIDDLRRRVQQDPASIAFAQLAEEYRRAGRFTEAIDTCRAGLLIHPGYLSAHVTLGRALADTGALDAARQEFELVIAQAPTHLAATRALADLHHRLGNADRARAYLEAADHLTPADPAEPGHPRADGHARPRLAAVPPTEAAAPAGALPAEASPVQPRRMGPVAATMGSAREGRGAVEDTRAQRVLTELERWLEAIHATRADRRPETPSH